MEFDLLAAITGGFIGAVVMTLMMNGAKAAGMTSMDMVLMQGAMVTGDRKKAKGIGLVTHLVMMGAIVLGSIYAWLFSLLDVAPEDLWWVGALIGVVHGIIAGMAMAMMPTMHPRMGGDADTAGDEIHLRSPGLFGKNHGKMTPVGIMMAHIVYGLVVGLVYGWLV
jgi:hypothetical protein